MKNGGRLLRRVRLDSREQRFTFELPSKPTIVEFDPEENLLKKVKFEKPVSMLLSQLEASVDASSRRRAAEALSGFRSFDVVQALERAAKLEEQHFSVRSEGAKSLGKIGSREALEALLGLTAVRNRRVRRAVVAALGEFKGEERLAGPLKDALRKDESPYVQCEAAVSYGKAKLRDAYEVITSAVGSPSPEEAITEACLEALGYVRDQRTRGFLRGYLPYGNPLRARVGALKGLSRLGWLEEEEVATLKELLKQDKEFTVRAEVLEMAAELLDRRFLEVVKEAAERDIDPRARRRAMEVALRLEDAKSVEVALAHVREEPSSA